MTKHTIHSKKAELLTKFPLWCILYNTVKVWFLRIIQLPRRIIVVIRKKNPARSLNKSFLTPTASAKEKTMSNSSNRSFWSRTVGSVIALTFVTLLVACGGGGGSTATPVTATSTDTTTPAKILSVTTAPPDGAVVASGTAVTVTVANATVGGSAVLACDGNPVATATVAASGTTTVAMASGTCASYTTTATVEGVKVASTFTVAKTVKYTLIVVASGNAQIPVLVEGYTDGTFAKRTLTQKVSFTMNGLCLVQAVATSQTKRAANCLDTKNVAHNVIIDRSSYSIVDDDGSLGTMPSPTNSAYWANGNTLDVDANAEHAITLKSADGSSWVEDGYAGMITYVSPTGTKTIVVAKNSLGGIRLITLW